MNHSQNPWVAEMTRGCRERAHAKHGDRSREAVAATTGVTLNTIVRLEQGYVRNHRDPNFLGDYADAVEMDRGERRSLLVLHGRIEPPRAPDDGDLVDEQVLADQMSLVSSMQLPAVLTDHLTTIVHANDAFHELWEGVYIGDNIIRKIITDLQLHRQLDDWQARWALPTLRVLKTYAVETEDSRAMGFFLQMERAFRQLCPSVDLPFIGQHAGDGDVVYKRNSAGHRLGMRIHALQRMDEHLSGLVVRIFEPV